MIATGLTGSTLSRAARLSPGKTLYASGCTLVVFVSHHSHFFAFRWAALASSFLGSAEILLAKTEAESNTLWDSLKVWERESRTGKPKASGKKKAESDEATEVWANVRFTYEFCMAKVEGSPYWPAKKCVAKDEQLVSSLHAVGRTLVSLIGEKGGLRAVRLEEIKPFDGTTVEEGLEEYPKAIRTQLDEVSVILPVYTGHLTLLHHLTSCPCFSYATYSAWSWLDALFAGESRMALGVTKKRRRWLCSLKLQTG